MRFRVGRSGIGYGAEFAEFGLDTAFCQAAHEPLMLQAVADQPGDRDHLEIVAVAEFLELRNTRHRAVLVHDFANDSGGGKAGQTREVNGGFGLAGAHEHTAFAGTERQNMSRPREVRRPRLRVDDHADRARAIGGRHARRNTFSRIHGFAKRRAEARRIPRGDRRQLKVLATFRGQREADQAATVGDHEVDDLRRDLFGGHREIALVFTVFVVHDDEHSTGANIFDGLRDGSKWHRSTVSPVLTGSAARRS